MKKIPRGSVLVILGSLLVIGGYASEVLAIAPPAPPSTCVGFMRTLRLGMSNTSGDHDVSRLQQFLQSTGDFTYPIITGYFGAITEAAVKRFQTAHGVVSGGSALTTGWGVVGPKTRERIREISCGQPNPPSPLPAPAPLPAPFPVSTTPPPSVSPTSVPTVRLISPNGGETLTMGQTFTIRWDGTNLPVDGVLSLALRDAAGVSVGSGIDTYCQDTPCINISARSYAWTVPSNIPAGQYKLHLVCGAPYSERYCTSLAGVRVEDSSDNLFTISGTSNLSPTALSFTGPTTLGLGVLGAWNASARDPEGRALSFRVDWGDMSVSENRGAAVQSQSVVFTHAYSSSGTFYPSLRVTDDGGGGATYTSFPVAVGNQFGSASVTVKNASTQAVISTAVVIVSDGQGNFVAQNPVNSSGVAVFSNLPLGSYRAEARANGFTTAQQDFGVTATAPNPFVTIALTPETTQPPPAGFPDLRITAITLNPAKTTYSKSEPSLSVSMTFTNSGTVASGPYDVTTRNKTNNWALPSGSGFLSLAPGASYTWTIGWTGGLSWTVEGATNEFEVTIDPTGAIAESNESNNSATKNIFVAASESPTTTSTCPVGKTLAKVYYTRWHSASPIAYADQSNHALTAGTMISIRWRDIEPSAGQFNWSTLDSAIAAATKPVTISVVPYSYWAPCAGEANPNCDTPNWVYDTVPKITYAGGADVYVGTTISIPKVWDGNYYPLMERLANALQTKYGSDSRVSLIQVNPGFLGTVEYNYDAGANTASANAGWTLAVWETHVKRMIDTFSSRITKPLFIRFTERFKSQVSTLQNLDTAKRIAEYAAGKGVSVSFADANPDWPWYGGSIISDLATANPPAGFFIGFEDDCPFYAPTDVRCKNPTTGAFRTVTEMKRILNVAATALANINNKYPLVFFFQRPEAQATNKNDSAFNQSVYDAALEYLCR